MTETQAEQIFDSFDKDKNGVMSIWEFEQYYQCVGEGLAFDSNLTVRVRIFMNIYLFNKLAISKYILKLDL